MHQTYTNADLKICHYLRLHMKIICSRFHIITPFTFVRYAHVEISEKFLYKHSETIKIYKLREQITWEFLGLRCKIFSVLFSYERKHILRFSKLHLCAFYKQLLDYVNWLKPFLLIMQVTARYLWYVKRQCKCEKIWYNVVQTSSQS